MKKTIKWLVIVLALCLLAMPSLAAFKTVEATLTYRDISIAVDGEAITPTDISGASTEPFIIDGTTYIPVRAVSEALGCNVDWDDAANTVIITTKGESGGWGDTDATSGASSSGSSSWGSDVSIETTEIIDGFYMINESRTRAFLAVGEDKALLIDTMYEDDNVLEEVRKVTDLPIEVVITHGHPDHIGGIGFFNSCYIDEDDAYFLPEGIDATYIQEGDILECGDFAFEVIETPGHSHGSISLLDRATGILISGDEVQEGPVFMFDEECSMNDYVASMEKLLTYANDVKMIFAGHHTAPSGVEYIQYCYEDAQAYLDGKLTGAPMSMMGMDLVVYQGEHVSFLLGE